MRRRAADGFEDHRTERASRTPGTLAPREVMARALAEQAARMAARVRDGLSDPPGGSGHDEPWLQSGALRNSVGAQADGLQAVVGSSDPAAIPQEMGTTHLPPRPFLAPAGAAMAEEVAEALGKAVVRALQGDDSDEHGAAEATGIDHGAEPCWLRLLMIHKGSKWQEPQRGRPG